MVKIGTHELPYPLKGHTKGLEGQVTVTCLGDLSLHFKPVCICGRSSGDQIFAPATRFLAQVASS